MITRHPDNPRAEGTTHTMTYSQPPGEPPRQAYAPSYPYPPRRRSWPARHKILAAGVGALGLLAAVSVLAALAGSGDHTVSTTGQPAASTSPAATSHATARVGSAITLAGTTSGEKMTVTVTRVTRNARPASEFDVPDQGSRLYAVQFRLANTGSAAYSDSPSNGAVVTDAAGQSYQASVFAAAGCQPFPGTENIAAGQSGLGCVVFQVPARAVITAVQFTLDSGFGPQTGQWDVHG